MTGHPDIIEGSLEHADKLEMDQLILLQERRYELAKDVPQCPRCSTKDEVRLTVYDVIPAVWRCKTCQVSFEYESGRLGEIL